MFQMCPPASLSSPKGMDIAMTVTTFRNAIGTAVIVVDVLSKKGIAPNVNAWIGQLPTSFRQVAKVVQLTRSIEAK